ncbi:UNVERIFIED_CONTAM: hypothetical protein K2H54_061258 [Gekko kuhli]
MEAQQNSLSLDDSVKVKEEIVSGDAACLEFHPVCFGLLAYQVAEDCQKGLGLLEEADVDPPKTEQPLLGTTKMPIHKESLDEGDKEADLPVNVQRNESERNHLLEGSKQVIIIKESLEEDADTPVDQHMKALNFNRSYNTDTSQKQSTGKV